MSMEITIDILRDLGADIKIYKSWKGSELALEEITKVVMSLIACYHLTLSNLWVLIPWHKTFGFVKQMGHS